MLNSIEKKKKSVKLKIFISGIVNTIIMEWYAKAHKNLMGLEEQSVWNMVKWLMGSLKMEKDMDIWDLSVEMVQLIILYMRMKLLFKILSKIIELFHKSNLGSLTIDNFCIYMFFYNNYILKLG